MRPASIRFSGGTPGVRLDKDRYVAVGHAVGDLSCFHKVVGQQGKGADFEMDLVEHPCDASSPAPKSGYEWWQHHFPNGGHRLHRHHFSW